MTGRRDRTVGSGTSDWSTVDKGSDEGDLVLDKYDVFGRGNPCVLQSVPYTFEYWERPERGPLTVYKFGGNH